MSVLLSETSSHYQPAANPPLRLKFSLIPPLKIRLPNYRIQERLSNAPNSTKKPGHLSHHHGLPIGGRRQKGLSYPGQPIKRLKLVFKSQKSPMLASAPFSKASIRVSSKSIAQKPRRGRRGRAVTKTAASAALRTPRSKRKRDDTAIQLYKSTPSQPLDISPVEKEPPVSTKEKAHSMLKWALLKNPVLTRDFEVRQFLGWGGCGCVLGAIRRSDLQQVCFPQFAIQRSRFAHTLSRFCRHPTVRY